MSQQQPISPKALIFAVDDEPANLEMMVRALGRTYDVRPFTDPHEALAAAQLTPPDMMIVDQRMPGLTGIQLLRALKGLHLECATLMVTAYPELTDVVSFESHKQIFRVIPKPWKPRICWSKSTQHSSSSDSEKQLAGFQVSWAMRRAARGSSGSLDSLVEREVCDESDPLQDGGGISSCRPKSVSHCVGRDCVPSAAAARTCDGRTEGGGRDCSASCASASDVLTGATVVPSASGRESCVTK